MFASSSRNRENTSSDEKSLFSLLICSQDSSLIQLDLDTTPRSSRRMKFAAVAFRLLLIEEHLDYSDERVLSDLVEEENLWKDNGRSIFDSQSRSSLFTVSQDLDHDQRQVDHWSVISQQISTASIIIVSSFLFVKGWTVFLVQSGHASIRGGFSIGMIF
jgi:hypothetical protein